tara:strand:+ start:58 stop:519 length:462 start_codon:yes stop_codon:yes gene_type:complete
MRWLKLTIFISLLLLVIFLSVTALAFSERSFSPERNSPQDWIKEEQIRVFKDKVVIELSDATWASFTNTNSMDPFIDENSHAIELTPQKPDDVQIGDVISYSSSYGQIIHRVIEKNVDEKGDYYIVQGDNNPLADPIKVRFDDVTGVVVAVIY